LHSSQDASDIVADRCEPTLVKLRDGRLLTLFRLVSGNRLHIGGSGGGNLWQAYSSSGGRAWTGLAATPLWSVWPQAVLMGSGVLAVSSGRPGVGLWLSASGDGAAWEYHNVIAQHNNHVPPERRYPSAYANVSKATDPDSCDTSHCMTTAYTGLVEAEPSTLLLAYDRRHGCVR